MKKHLKIKVCGLTLIKNLKDIEALGVDYLGMIFYDKSPRSVTDNNLSISTQKAKKVGVFVNESIENIIKYQKVYNFSIVQLHGNESPEYCKALKEHKLEVWKAFGINEAFNFNIFQDYKAVDLFVLDTFTPNHGGSGKKFNWELLKGVEIPKPFLLSGGIHLNDISAIRNINHPMFIGIDVNSKFEVKPGVKDIGMVKDLINQINKI